MNETLCPPFYIDLFDDGIPSANPLLAEIKPGSIESKLLDAARFQILLAILFDRQIVIPESWATSSPTFLRVFAEVMEHFPKKEQRSDASGKVRINTINPFVFCFFSDTKGHPAQVYLKALTRRLEQGRRVKWLPEHLSATGPTFGDISARATIADCLKKHCDKVDSFTPYDYEKLEDHLAEAIRISCQTPSYDNGSGANAILSVIRYLGNARSINETQYWGAGGGLIHKNTVEGYVSTIWRVLREDKILNDKYKAEASAFLKFFCEVDNKEVATSDVMSMWEILRNYDSETQKTAEAFGRYALNLGYGKSMGAIQSSMSFEYYCQGAPAPFANALLSCIIKEEHASHDPSTSFNSFFKLAPSQNYDLDDVLDWEAAWRTSAAVARNPKWRQKRDGIEKQLLSVAGQDHNAVIDIWCELFDEISGSFQDISFEVNGGDRPTVKILKKAIEKAEVIAAISKEVEYLTIDLTPFFSFLKRPATFLARLIPTKQALPLVRHFRTHVSPKMTNLVSHLKRTGR